MTSKSLVGLVVVAHPDPASLNHALAMAVAATWQDCGIPTELVDLHVIGFDPILSAGEARGKPSSDQKVCKQIDLLLASHLVAVVHPNCWGAPPAMMKGWMDRVFAPDAAYAFAKGADDGSAPVGLLRGKRALVINTSNTPLERETDVFGDPLEKIWSDCLLGYCGFSLVRRRVFRVVASSTQAERAQWISDAAEEASLLAKGVA
jgi:NAD(P)H dehydrogenase (quinone)